MDQMNYALIFASGVGSRMRSTVGPKQFLEVKGKPLLVYTLERFQTHKQIDGIYLVVRKSKEVLAKSLIEEFSLSKVQHIVTDDDEGELSAHASILNGIMEMKLHGVQDDDVVLIHDGVRPILDEGSIAKCIATAKKMGNAITCMPAQETIAYKEGDDRIGEVTHRDNMIILQAPQAFQFKDAYDVNVKSLEDGIVGSVVDQAELHRHYGNELYTIEGLKGNVKITVPLDFTYFEFLVESKKYYHIIKGETV
ncbi:MAG TPA: IspD/TarI family cytidylyltransferase [Candidatus Saccharimonadales bacterium]|nr:IspD/TarI family cytidylyltransferase [Candidatus Saccharimonadales bacterium]